MRLLLVLGLVGSVFALVASIMQLQSAHRDAGDAVKRVEACQNIASKVESLRNAVNEIDVLCDANYQPGERIASALKRVGLPDESLGVSVRSGRSLKGSNIQEKRIEMSEIKDATLEQVVRFAYELQIEKPNVQLNFLSLKPNPKNTTPGTTPPTWNAAFDFSFFVPMEEASTSAVKK
jgi:hypothetical protein